MNYISSSPQLLGLQPVTPTRRPASPQGAPPPQGHRQLMVPVELTLLNKSSRLFYSVTDLCTLTPHPSHQPQCS